MSSQTTLKRKISIAGIGLHSGSKVTCTIHPAPANHGIVFIRSDLPSQPQIRANILNVIRTDLSTTLGSDGVIVATVEHLMAAIAGLSVDNALIELNGPEVPIMDGSSRAFVEAIEDADIRNLGLQRKFLRLKRQVSVFQGDKYIKAVPANSFSIKASIDFDHKTIGKQIYKFSDKKNFCTELASARTFGFLHEVEYLREKGLALGGSLENAIVLDNEGVLNSEGLRFKNEFVRHKVLDAMGDFRLLGLELGASIEIHKSGHELHTSFICKVLQNSANYEIIESEKARLDSDSALDSDQVSALVAHAY